ncbi:hypothetical protein BH10BAC1_BH10BAC1_21660 [soil metagenome]
MIKGTKYLQLFFYIVFTTLSIPFIAQTNDYISNQKQIDSLQTLIDNSTNDSIKVELLISISNEYQGKDRLKSFDNVKAALTLAQKINNKNEIGRCLNYLGDMNWFSGDYTTASDYYFKALKIYEDIKDESGISQCYRNIGWIYQGQRNFPLTIEYYNKALEINQKLGLKRDLISNYDDLGIVNKLMGNYPKALEYCNKALALSKELNTTKGIASGYGNLGGIYFEMKKYDLAIDAFLKANTLHLTVEDHYNTVEDYLGLAECYMYFNQPEKAVHYAKMAMTLAKEKGFRISLGNAYLSLSKAYANQKDYTNAYSSLFLFSNLKDSTYNEKNSRQINEMSAKYESEKKELMINSLEKDKTISAEKSAQDKKFKIYLIIFLLLVAIFTLFLFRGFLQKKKANNSLSLAYKESEVKNKDITDSINYAKLIQRARLPNPSIILNHLPEAFGLYKPKDVVSGDFYWFAEHENGKILLAAADCTGHGIPGAFMSMIGIDELNHAALEKRFDDVSTILSSVNIGVKKALRQNEQNSMSRDGMDLALCIFDLKNNKLEYAGANRPLYYIRENQLFELSPTKAAIGGLTPNNQAFKNHIIPIQKGDMIYVFTDGYADQFGVPSGKKFMTKQFKELLLSIHQKPIAEQEAALEKALNDWRKDISQVDDILVMGVRI